MNSFVGVTNYCEDFANETYVVSPIKSRANPRSHGDSNTTQNVVLQATKPSNSTALGMAITLLTE